MNDINVAEMKKELSEKLIGSGLPEEEANQVASREIDSMGVVKTRTGQCPLGISTPTACIFCRWGHMIECHHPLTCEEADCSHYQAERIDVGEYAGLLEE